MSDRLRALLTAALLACVSVPAGAAASQPEPTEAELHARAERGDAEALNELGSRILQAEDQARFGEARELFRQSSEAGDAEGKSNYAFLLINGLGGPADEALGRRLRQEAADAGSFGALMTLADRHTTGEEGYQRDPARALALLVRAAELDNEAASYAQWRVAMMHLQGVGTSANAGEAYRWVVRAAENGAVNGMISRAVMLATGEGVAENDPEARLWYQRAAESGDVNSPHALRGLGIMLIAGEGGPVDLERGFAYLFIAKAGGDENADASLERFDSRLTPAIRERAFAIANEWMAEHFPESSREAAASGS